MKNFLKILGIVLLVPYVIIAIILTVFLLNYNKYGVTEMGGKTYIPVTSNELMPNYKKGDLLVVKNAKNDEINENDYIFFYEQNQEKKDVVINLARVVSKRVINENETTYTLEGDVAYSSEYVIGTKRDTKVYGSLGSIVSILESRWVFLIFVILPILFIFLFELYTFAIEVKKNLKEA